MFDDRQLQIRDNLKQLTAMHAAAISVLEESIAILQAEFDDISQGHVRVAAVDSAANPELPFINRRVMSVVFRGAHCYLGNTLMLKFMERLVQRPNQYISHDVLLREVWHAVRDPSSIRSVVKELRAKLRAAQMSELADAIDGRVSGHYGLMLEHAK